MNHKKLLLIILIIILLLSGYLCIHSNQESFQNSNMNEQDIQIIESIKTGLANKLKISPRRIKNLTYNGEPKQFTNHKLQVNFDIADRNQFEMNEKNTQELKKEINKQLRNLEKNKASLNKENKKEINMLIKEMRKMVRHM